MTGALKGFRHSVAFGERLLVQDSSHETARRILALVYFITRKIAACDVALAKRSE